MVYDDGTTARYIITKSGVVTATINGASAVSGLHAWDGTDCPSTPCARLQGIYSDDEFELISLDSSLNQIQVKKWTNQVLCCTATSTKGEKF